MIPQRNISMISNTLVTAGGRRIPEAVIERDYVLAWFLTGLAGHALQAWSKQSPPRKIVCGDSGLPASRTK